MNWTPGEIELLPPILHQVETDLGPLEGKSILVLCSALAPLLPAECLYRNDNPQQEHACQNTDFQPVLAPGLAKP